jgi:UDP-N-acetylglucosamine diphosphorylase / glucose-1-phosphate thymidylyltransferase / UDP-N-acetylgalactosamine diphosphorylase / glucosamine-1-phosphate N-acetyltransferase / galactosamine-1-phosphate N-acetyltransferase
MSMEFAVEEFFDLSGCEHRALFENVEQVWDVLPKIAKYLQFRLKPGLHGRLVGRPFVSGAVFVGKGTVIEQGAMVKGPAWIGENCEIRAGCYIRENVIIGDGVVAGNSSEFKNCLVMDGAQVPHFNYVGDSILGIGAHLGAGVILSNVRLDKAPIVVRGSEGGVSTGLRKFGAIVGDRAEIGCNAVLSPGSLVGRNAVVYPGSQWRGFLPANHMAKLRQEFTVVRRDGTL